MKRTDKKRLCFLLFLIIVLFVSGCSSDEAESSVTNTVSAETTEAESSRDKGKDKGEETETHYAIPEFLENSYSTEDAIGKNDVYVDLTHVEEGYFGICAKSDARLKIRVIKGEEKYTYDLKNNKEIAYYPLQSGDGSYTIQVMENVYDNKYTEKYRTEVEVHLSDEFQPFLHTSVYVDYTRDSECVKKAESFAKEAKDANDFLMRIYDFVCSTVTYDKEKAANIKSGYIPVPDETMETGKGICFDYASLAASMLRSQGIPTKLIFGYVAPNDLYHAWNMVYTEESGWITVEFAVDEGWNRVDLTFSANGSDSEFIGNGENYADVYQY